LSSWKGSSTQMHYGQVCISGFKVLVSKKDPSRMTRVLFLCGTFGGCAASFLLNDNLLCSISFLPITCFTTQKSSPPRLLRFSFHITITLESVVPATQYIISPLVIEMQRQHSYRYIFFVFSMTPSLFSLTTCPNPISVMPVISPFQPHILVTMYPPPPVSSQLTPRHHH